MASQYKLNNNDLLTTFGVVVEGGSNSFLAYPSRKDSMTHDFTDKNGLDIDLQDPRFNSREFTLNCALTASSVEDFWTKYNALFTELSNSGTHKLSITDLGRDYRVYYKEQRNIRKLTPLSGKPEVWIKFDLVFGEANWTDNIEAVYLIDHDGNYLIQ